MSFASPIAASGAGRLRAAPLKRTPLGRGEPPKRKRPMRRESAKRRRRRPARQDCMAEVRRRAGGRCELRVPGVCTTWGTQGHEPAKRSQGANATDPAQVKLACDACHKWVHRNVAAAVAMGLLIQRKAS